MEELQLTAQPGALSLLTRVGRFLTEREIESYLVGGWVRDLLLKRDTADIDIAVDADALKIAAEIATALGGKYIPLDEVNGVGRVVLSNHETASTEGRWEIDFSTLRGNIDDDLAYRDFTINAMAIRLKKAMPGFSEVSPAEERDEITFRISEIIDPFRGRDDLRQGIIRVVSETAFESDAARLLRAVRLAAELGFSIERGTESLIRQHCQLIADVPGERVREELLRILDAPQAGQLVAYLDESGLLTAMIPELAQAKGVDQPTVHFWDVFDHSIQTVATVSFLLRQQSWAYAGEEILSAVPWSAGLQQHFEGEVSSGSTRTSLLKLAALLHDIAKPQTKTVDEDGRARFLGHTSEGAAIVAGVLERLRFSAREIKLVETLVKYHLRPGQMGNYEVPSRRAIYRYFRDTGGAGIDILFLSLADHLATRGPLLDKAQWQMHTRLVDYVLTRYFEEESQVAPSKLIDGHDLINIYGLSPGHKIGELLETVREAQAAGEVTSREEALAYTSYLLGRPEATQ